MNSTKKNYSEFKSLALLFNVSPFIVSCECNDVECPLNDDAFVEINLLQNGQDIVFGDSPLVDRNRKSRHN
jgi:hypothetical protein